MANNTRIKSLDVWGADPRIERIDDERRPNDDGLWAYARLGFYFDGMGCHTAHERTAAALIRMLKTVMPCRCTSCVVDLAPLTPQQRRAVYHVADKRALTDGEVGLLVAYLQDRSSAAFDRLPTDVKGAVDAVTVLMSQA